MCKLFFVKLFLIFNTATVTDITKDHNLHRHINIETFAHEKISHLSLVHSVGKWRTLALEAGFHWFPEFLRRHFLIADAVRDWNEWKATHHMSEGK